MSLENEAPSAEIDIRSSLREIIDTYHDLNPSVVDEFQEEPSPLEFMRYVANNRPFVVRGAVTGWKAYGRWNVDYFKQKLADSTIQVAVTPDGRADAPRRSPQDGKWCFAKPQERNIQFSDFIDYVRRPTADFADGDEIWYAQTQNDNLRGEYAELFNDVEQEIRWASIALGYGPDAINMWIGSCKSTTAMHRDPYQNIFCQLIGKKHFVLVSPIETPCVNEQFLPPATWVQKPEGLQLELDEDPPPIPCAMWNPESPSANCSALSDVCKPIRVTLQPGDMLYLPAMWYHQVSQTEGLEGFCCAVNYWYDMEYGGAFFPHDQFVRIQSRAVGRAPS